MDDEEDNWLDVEWEDNDCPDSDHEAGPPAGGAVTAPGTPAAAYSLHLDIDTTVACDVTDSATAKKRKAYVPTAEDRDLAVELHRECLVGSLSRAAALSGATNDEELRALLLSLVPPHLCNEVIESGCGCVDAALSGYKALLEWFVQNFTVVADKNLTDDEGRDGSGISGLLRVASSRAGSAHQLTQAFVSLARALGIGARYVVSLKPPPPVPSAFPQIKRMRADTSAEIGDAGSKDGDCGNSVHTPADIAGSVPPPQACWAEVLVCASSAALQPQPHAVLTTIDLSQEESDIHFTGIDYTMTRKGNEWPAGGQCSSASKQNCVVDLTDEPADTCTPTPPRWVCVQIGATPYFDCPQLAHQNCGGPKSVGCVLAIDSWGTMVDVTPRYLSCGDQLLQCRSQRYNYKWLKLYIKEINSSIRSYSSSDIERRDLFFQGDSDLSALESTAERVMPSTLAGFKNHRYFALEQQLRVDEAVNPIMRSVVGVFKGVPVFPRNSVEQLLSTKEWKRVGKRVVTGARPVKIRGHSDIDQGGNKSQDVSTKRIAVNLYGSWQTESIVRDVVQDGILPTNDHGNIEVLNYNASLIPVGSRYVEEDFAEAAAKKLEIPFAKALVGFENKRGRVGVASFPIFDGVVVLEEHADLVTEVAISMLGNKLVQKTKSIEAKIVMRWQNIVNGVLLRHRIKETYGH